jgi:hypothetical protein
MALVQELLVKMLKNYNGLLIDSKLVQFMVTLIMYCNKLYHLVVIKIQELEDNLDNKV